jgi:hypothetical protein
MIIDCDACLARGAGAGGASCLNCAATALRGPGPAFCGDQDLDPATLRALTVLADAGMIAPLRYAPRLAQAS